MHANLIKRILREGQIFSLFDEREIEALAVHMFRNLQRFSKGEIVFIAGDCGAASARIYVVLEGVCKVSAQNASGSHEVILNVLTEGATFGELSMFDGSPRSATVCAMTDCVLAFMHRGDFFLLAQENPEMLEKVILFLCGEIRRLSQRFEQVASLSVKQRLAAMLLALAATFKGRPIPLTQQELSGAVGTTREQTSRILGQFYREGWIEKVELYGTPKEVTETHEVRAGNHHARIQVTLAGLQALSALAFPDGRRAV